MDECIDEFLSISETLKGYGAHKFNVHVSSRAGHVIGHVT